MTNQLDNWIERQTQRLFSGIERPRKGKRSRFSWFLALPFFFVPILIAGYFVAEVGDSLSKKSVAFIRSLETRPAVVERSVATTAKPKSKKRSLVASQSN